MIRRLSALALVAMLAACGGSSSAAPPPTNPIALPTATSGLPPWPGPQTGVSGLAGAVGLQMLPAEAFNEHIHAHLDVFYNGQPVVVPAQIGIDLEARAISPVHTHDTSGIVHIESPTVKPYTLGQFFGEWNVAVKGQCVAGQCPAKLVVNGASVTTSIADYVLNAHDEIAVVIGTAPTSVPGSYQFPAGY